MQKILFIINPVSGTKRKEKLVDLIHAVFKPKNIEYKIEFTKYARHAKEIACNAVGSGFDCMVAVGGDGSVNEVASALVGSSCLLGIIPVGSGNGLARSLRISMNARTALAQILRGTNMEIDTLSLNGQFFVNMAGIGFDAQVSHLFRVQKKRGLLSYLKAIVITINRFKPIHISFTTDNIIYRKNIFLMSFANSGQYGNNAYIAPLASLNDGLIDVIVIKPFAWYAAPGVVFSLLTKQIHKRKYYKSYQVKEIKIETDKNVEGHIDGEAIFLDQTIKVAVGSKKLRVICGK